jgi:lipoate-protein ligase A
MTDSNYSRSVWRLIVHPPMPGAWNMAVDEAILEAAGAGRVLPTLRLYRWEPACLSLGYAQPASDADLEAIGRNGWQMVRRPTGGRAILHTDELTYSVTGPENEPRLAGGVLESYRRLAQALLGALHRLGVPAQALPKNDPMPGSDPRGPVCFEVPSNYEITVGGKKLLGSAQARRKEGVLQHGSLPLYSDLSRITRALVYPDEAARTRAAARLLERAANLEMILGQAPTWEQAAEAMQAAFAAALHLDLQPGELTAAEQARVEVLLAGKYQAGGYTFKI